MTKQTAAFFDIDGTLFRNSLLIEHFLLLAQINDKANKLWEEEIKPLYEKYKNRQGAFEEYLDKAAVLYKDALIGLDKQTIEEIAKVVINSNKHKTYNLTRKRVAWHLERGHKVFFISGSPSFLVDDFAKHFKIDEAVSTIYEFDDKDIFTGGIIPMWDNRSKLDAIKKLTKKYDIDLKSSYSYGDTNGDITMMDMVGNPTAINPSWELLDKLNGDEELREKATIAIERKDVNYSFKLSDMVVDFSKF